MSSQNEADLGICQRTLCHANAPMGKVCVCQCDSYSHTNHTSKTAYALPGLLQTQPRAVCACSGHVCLPACVFTLLLICLPQDPERMTVPTKQHIYILMCIDFISLISHMAHKNKYTLVIPHWYSRPSFSHQYIST